MHRGRFPDSVELVEVALEDGIVLVDLCLCSLPPDVDIGYVSVHRGRLPYGIKFIHVALELRIVFIHIGVFSVVSLRCVLY